MGMIKRGVKEHFLANRRLYFIFVFLLFLGFVAGVLFVRLVPEGERGFITSFCTSGEVSFWGSFWNSIGINARLWALVALAGYFKPLRLLSGLTMVIKGFALGFTIRFAVITLGTRGLLLVFVSSLPNILLLLPILIYFCVCSARVRNRGKWLVRSGFIGALMAGCSLIDGFVVPIFVKGIMTLFQ